MPLTPEIDQAALVGFPVAERLLGLSGHPTSIYLRAAPDQVSAVIGVLPFTANPAQPEGVQVSRPSALLTARVAARTALTGLLLALGAVAVIVGAMGIMIISVLERRTEIGLRRALGARRHHVATQFVVESLLLCGLGDLAGVAPRAYRRPKRCAQRDARARGLDEPRRAGVHVVGDPTRPLVIGGDTADDLLGARRPVGNRGISSGRN